MLVTKIDYSDLVTHPEFEAWKTEYAEETGDKTMAPPETDLTAYEQMDNSGMLRCFAATEDGHLAGVLVVVAAPSLHYGRRMAHVDALYLRKAYRKGRLGVRIIEVVKSALKEEGIQEMFLTAPADSNLDRLAPHLGFHLYRRQYLCSL